MTNITRAQYEALAAKQTAEAITGPKLPEGPSDVADCKHKWELIHDWIGDQNVINGAQHFSYFLCRKCDEQTQEQPDGWDDRDGPEYERDEDISP